MSMDKQVDNLIFFVGTKKDPHFSLSALEIFAVRFIQFILTKQPE